MRLLLKFVDTSQFLFKYHENEDNLHKVLRSFMSAFAGKVTVAALVTKLTDVPMFALVTFVTVFTSVANLTNDFLSRVPLFLDCHVYT